ncbi:MAG: hypothetical protein N3F06_00465, partial [Nitrososphaerales archaeon]|nr:hypothetical protein [Nitrososphaerales archaeon]
YPIFLIFISYLISPNVRLSKISLNQAIKASAIILILASPFILFIAWRSKMAWTIVYTLPLIILFIGLILLIYGMRKSHI